MNENVDISPAEASDRHKRLLGLSMLALALLFATYAAEHVLGPDAERYLDIVSKGLEDSTPSEEFDPFVDNTSLIVAAQAIDKKKLGTVLSKAQLAKWENYEKNISDSYYYCIPHRLRDRQSHRRKY